MPIGLGALAIGSILGGAISGIGMGLNNTQRQQSFGDQKKLMELQQKNQLALNRNQQEIEMENWENTNYNAQRQQMEKAGLNPGLMYGGSGGGSMIMDSGTGGSAASGQVQRKDLDTTALGMQIQQMAMLKAQKDNLEASTNKTNAEADKIRGVETENIGTDIKLKNLDYKLKTEGFDSTLYGLKAEADKKQSEARSALVKANVDENTKNSQVDKIKSEAINEAFKLAVMESGIKLNEAEMKNMEEQIKIGKFNAEKITTDQVAGKQLNSLIEKIYDIFGIKNETLK